MVRYPKRKRTAVKYYQSDPEDYDAVEPCEDVSDDDLPKSAKKARTKASKQKPILKKQVFPFMALPAELRNRIYEFALTDPNDHLIVSERREHRRVTKRVGTTSFFLTRASKYERHERYSFLYRKYGHRGEMPQGAKRELRPVMLRLNKKIYDESIGYLYRHKFVFSDTHALHDFLTQIGPNMRPRLHSIEVAEWGYTSSAKAMNYPAMSLLADAINLEHVWLRITHYSQQSLAAKIFRDCSTFLLRYGRAKGRKDAAIDVLKLRSSEDEQELWQMDKSLSKPAWNKNVLERVRNFIERA